MGRHQEGMRYVFRSALFIAILMVLFITRSRAQENRTVSLFQLQGDQIASEVLPSHQFSSQPIRLNPDVLREGFLETGDRLSIQIGNDTDTYLIRRISRFTDDTYSVIAESEQQDRILSFSIHGEQISGTIHLHDRMEIYQLQWDAARKSNMLTGLNHSELDILDCPVDRDFAIGDSLADSTGEDTGFRRADPPETTANQPVTIDLMVVYTNSAENYMEKQSNTSLFIAEVVNRSQSAMDASNVEIDLNLVHTEKTSYSETPSNCGTNLSDLAQPNDGNMDNIHDLRNQHDADMVTLFANLNDCGGIAYLLGDPDGDPSSAFSVNRVQQMLITYTMAHELGHNMGNHHSRNQSSSAAPSSGGLFNYSTGWRWTGSNGQGYASVMTYNEGDFETPHFSNPNVTDHGAATGSYSGQYAPADNARSMNEMRGIIADYRTGGPEPVPDPPALDRPADGTTGLSTGPILEWFASSDADDYQVQVAASSSFNNPVINRNRSFTSVSINTTLNTGTTYYWRVRARNNFGNSDWSSTWSFTTQADRPSVPQLIAPSDGLLGTELSPELDWADSDRADNYRVQVSTSSSFGSPTVNQTRSDSDFKIGVTLEHFTTYYWRVRASNNAGSSDWSDTWEFTTTIATPDLVAPGDGATELPRTPQLDWTSVQHADFYLYQVSRNAGFTDLVFNEQISENGLTLSSPLSYLTTYYWRVRARNESTGIESEWTPVRSFETVIEPPDNVTAVEGPAENAAQVPRNPLLSWGPSNRAANYRIEVSESADFSSASVSATTTDTAYAVNQQLEYATQYYWRVRAENAGGASRWSNPKSFTTIVDETEITMNYPNPFDGSTTIRYQLAMETEVRLEVYNTLGRRIKLLVDERQEPKVYNYDFNAMGLASGVYVVRLATKNTSDVLMMTLIK